MTVYFSSSKGELYLSLNEQGHTNKAILNSNEKQKIKDAYETKFSLWERE